MLMSKEDWATMGWLVTTTNHKFFELTCILRTVSAIQPSQSCCDGYHCVIKCIFIEMVGNAIWDTEIPM